MSMSERPSIFVFFIKNAASARMAVAESLF